MKLLPIGHEINLKYDKVKNEIHTLPIYHRNILKSNKL